MARKHKAVEAAEGLPVHTADLQVSFWAFLQQIRNKHLSQALSSAVSLLQVAEIDRELTHHAQAESLSILARHGLRGETFFPVPCLLRTRPELLGYYRLLYGISQKEFYNRAFAPFKSMEVDNQLKESNLHLLSPLCRSLCRTGAQLLAGVQPPSINAVHELQLLTIGPQLRGSLNNRIGSKATRQVFNLVKSLISQRHVQTSTAQVIEVKNAAGRMVQIAFAADPDITIIERLATTDPMPNTSIEIKGGRDVSNVHNRIGEAEKSHLKAKAEGFTRFWTIVRARIDPAQAKQQSPTTTEFFNLDEIQVKTHRSHKRFKALLHQALGIS
jgi:hypothetical protein